MKRTNFIHTTNKNHSLFDNLAVYITHTSMYGGAIIYIKDTLEPTRTNPNPPLKGIYGVF